MDNLKLSDIKSLVFDFDGTMCRLFKNYNLQGVVSSLSTSMAKYGISFSLDNDAFEVFSEVVKQTEHDAERRILALNEADNIITMAEVTAVRTSEPVAFIGEVLPTLYNKGYSIGVATNNSMDCVLRFLEVTCPQLEFPIVGRQGVKPELMKPNPWSLIEVLKKMDGFLDNAIFIGDTQRDYSCARAVGCRFIGMASTETKMQKLLNLGISKDSIVSNYNELLTLLCE